jgi:hypothetical protein
MSENKKKMKELLNLLNEIYNYNLEKGNENTCKDIKNIKTNINVKFMDLCKYNYFNDILNIVFIYYDEKRDVKSENIYNNLLQLLEASTSSND